MSARARLGVAVLLGGLVLALGCARKAAKTTPEPVAPTPQQPVLGPSDSDKFQTGDMDVEMRAVLVPVYFDYDRYNLRSDAVAILEKIAPYLAANSQVRLVIEGHADERGTDEYNIGLGENRARAARQYLVGYGLAASRFEMVSYGKTRPANAHCEDDDCHSRNRRVEWQVLSR